MLISNITMKIIKISNKKPIEKNKINSETT